MSPRIIATVPKVLGALTVGDRVVEVAGDAGVSSRGTVVEITEDAFEASVTLRLLTGGRRLVKGSAGLRVVVEEPARPGHGAASYVDEKAPPGACISPRWVPWTVRSVDESGGVVKVTRDRARFRGEPHPTRWVAPGPVVFEPIELPLVSFALDSRGVLRCRDDRSVVLRIGRRMVSA